MSASTRKPYDSEVQDFLSEVAELYVQKKVSPSQAMVAFAHAIAELVVISSLTPEDVYGSLDSINREMRRHAVDDPLRSYRRWVAQENENGRP